MSSSPDLISQLAKTREKLRKLETGVTKYGREPYTGVTDPIWTTVTGRPYWTSSFGTVRVIADQVAFIAYIRAETGWEAHGSPFILPERFRPEEDVYFKTSTQFYHVQMTVKVGEDGTFSDFGFVLPNSNTLNVCWKWPFRR